MHEQDRINELKNREFLEQRRRLKEKRIQRRRKRTFFLLLAVVICISVAYLVTSNQFVRGLLYHDLNQKGAVNIPVDGSFVTDYQVFGDHVLSCSKNGVKAYSLNGSADWETTMSNLSTQMLSFGNPVLRTGKDHCLVYDKGGKSLLKFNQRSVSAVIDTDQPILFAKLFDNGFIAVVTKDSGSKEQVGIYDKKGQQIFIWHSGEENILDASLSANGQNLVISALDTQSGKLMDNLIFFDISQPDPYAGASKENMLITNLKFYNGNKNIVAISDTGVLHFNQNGDTVHSYDFGGRELSSFQYLAGGEVALVFNSNYENKYRIVIVDEGGREKGVYVTDQKIGNLAFDGRNIIANMTKGFHVISLRGKELRRQEIPKDIKRVLSAQRGKIVLVGTTEIDIVN